MSWLKQGYAPQMEAVRQAVMDAHTSYTNRSTQDADADAEVCMRVLAFAWCACSAPTSICTQDNCLSEHPPTECALRF